jgi:branched-subunit amino acid ABC-type transport system permease component
MNENDRRIVLLTAMAHGLVHTYELSIPILMSVWLVEFSVSAATLGLAVTVGYGLFGVGAALAALAGMLVSPIQPITPTMDFSMLLLAFVVVIFGGMGSYRGSVVAGLVLGQVMAFTTIFWAPGSNVIALVVLAVALLVQPEGLLGEPEVLE